MWHRHQWREVGRAWTGATDTIKMECSEHMAERMIFGMTVIELRCSVCGDVKSVELLGNHSQLAAAPR